MTMLDAGMTIPKWARAAPEKLKIMVRQSARVLNMAMHLPSWTVSGNTDCAKICKLKLWNLKSASKNNTESKIITFTILAIGESMFLSTVRFY
jgi:hypothetical protein